MIHPGTDLKFKVTAVGRGMTLADCGFAVVVRNSYGRVVFVAEKHDMMTDSVGGFYFMMKSVAAGVYTSTLTIEKPDINFDGSFQRIVDVSYLTSVGSVDTGRQLHETDGVAVCYERVWTVNIGEGVYLCDVNGTPILDSDGQPIMLNNPEPEVVTAKIDITAAELNRLLTMRDKNGKIDTVPEALDAVQDIGDDTELSVMTDTDTDDMMNRILGNGDNGGD